MSRELALCADDYGCTPAVNRAVLQLAGCARLSEVSCLVNGPAWAAGAAELAALQRQRGAALGVGLHLNLSEGVPLSAELAALWPRLPALPRLIALAHLRLLPLAALRAEIQAQLAAFEHSTGQLPSHLDGHQHVHHLPGVRQLVLEALATRAGVKVRDTGCVRGTGHAWKRHLIEATGGRASSRDLQARGLQANTQLLGVHGFSGSGYRQRMQRWLAVLPARGGLVFCHPGLAPSAQEAAHDPIAQARADEWSYLGSPAFADDLCQAGVWLRGSPGPV